LTARRLVVLGAAVTLVGAAVAALAPVVGTDAIERVHGQQTVGGLAVVVGWALLAWAVHRLGRESGLRSRGAGKV
jgi:hypothetical protein